MTQEEQKEQTILSHIKSAKRTCEHCHWFMDDELGKWCFDTTKDTEPTTSYCNNFKRKENDT